MRVGSRSAHMANTLPPASIYQGGWTMYGRGKRDSLNPRGMCMRIVNPAIARDRPIRLPARIGLERDYALWASAQGQREVSGRRRHFRECAIRMDLKDMERVALAE